jgi:hypothetical protein
LRLRQAIEEHYAAAARRAQTQIGRLHLVLVEKVQKKHSHASFGKKKCANVTGD